LTHRVNAPIRVICRGKQPVAFSWGGRLYTIVQVIDSWKEMGEWWEKAPEITVYQVMTDDQGLYELHYQAVGRWILYKIYD